MNTAMIVALAIAVPVILFPAAFVWYINLGGIVQAVRKVKAQKTVKIVA
jgi:hypothetical protein